MIIYYRASFIIIMLNYIMFGIKCWEKKKENKLNDPKICCIMNKLEKH